MPFIHIRAHSGRDLKTKIKVSQAIVSAASEIMGVPESVFTIAYEEFDREVWDEQVGKPILEPLRDKLLIEKGKVLVEED